MGPSLPIPVRVATTPKCSTWHEYRLSFCESQPTYNISQMTQFIFVNGRICGPGCQIWRDFIVVKDTSKLSLLLLSARCSMTLEGTQSTTRVSGWDEHGCNLKPHPPVTAVTCAH